MRGEMELALQKDRDLEEYKRVLKVNMEEIDRLILSITPLNSLPAAGGSSLKYF